MAKELKTGWKCIGRSGKTVDGRNIDPVMLTQAAKNYDPVTYTAMIWPEHYRWINLGSVEKLRTADNDEGGIDLFAIIAPNDYYRQFNAQEQKLFSSMELTPNFRDTGEWYLTGNAATDSPASAGTSEIRFTAGADKGVLYSAFTELADHQFDDEQPPSWFTKLFGNLHPTKASDEDTMDEKTKQALDERFTKIEQSLAALKPADKPSEEKPSEDFAALKTQFDELTQQFAALKAEKAEDKNADALQKLTEEFTALQAEFKAAVSEQKGTDAGEHFSAGDGDSIQTDC
ncbi:MAG: GPO family capsid scaffolding protein [Methylobacter sp.]